jgi:hypothetical protein
MKTLVAAAALAAAIASPALAQTSQRHAVPQQYPSQYDQTVGRTEQPRPTTNHSVYDNNQYLGADPDPNVRLELRRDYEGRDF